MNIIVSFHLLIGVHDNDMFKGAFQDTLKFFVTLHGLIRFGEFVFKIQILFGLQFLNEVFDVPDHVF
jgi:hypothetical protein